MIALGGAIALGACSGPAGGGAEGAEQVDPLHGLGAAAPADTTYTAVGILHGTGWCTGTLVAPDIVLTAAHCVGEIAQHCTSVEAAIVSGMSFTFAPSGDQIPTAGQQQSVTYPVDGVVIHPQAYPTPVGCGAIDRVDSDYDVALLHLKFNGQPSPVALGVHPMNVLTSDGPTDPTHLAPTTVHRIMARDWLPPSAISVGMGYDDRPDGPARESRRYAGPETIDIASSPVQKAHGAIHTHRADVKGVTAAGVFNDHVDSGGPFVYESPTLGAIIIGVQSRGNPQIGQGQTLPAGSPATATMTATYTTDVGRWLDDHLTDFDDDGVHNGTDNCVVVPNHDQANCNEAAEVAKIGRNEKDVYGDPKQRYGDACDPVPCPLATPVETHTTGTGTNSTTPCVQWSSSLLGTGSSCIGRPIKDVIDVTPVGAHIRYQHDTNVLGYVSFPVPNVTTEFRFCQNAPWARPPIDCGLPLVRQDDRLLPGVGPSVPEPAADWRFPYHRVTLAKRTSVAIGRKRLDVFTPHDRGWADTLDYGSSRATYKWDFASDEKFWLSRGIIPVTPPESECLDHGTFGTGTCLDGTFWVHGETLVGSDAAHVTVNGTRVDAIGDKLANRYDDFAPDPPTRWRASGGGVRLPLFFLWRTLSDPPDWVKKLPSAADPVIRFAGDPQSQRVYSVDASNRYVDVTENLSQGFVALVTNPRGDVLGASETSPLSGNQQVEAVVLSKDGTRFLDRVVRRGKELAVSTELEGGWAPRASDRSPAPRSDHVAIYSRVAGGVFVLGGTLLSNGQPAGDAWFATLDGRWTKLNLGGNTLGHVFGATYSFRDKNLWILQGSRKHPISLSRTDPRGSGLERLAEWSKGDLYDKKWLSLDSKGHILVVSSSDQPRKHRISRIVIDPALFRIAPLLEKDAPVVRAPVVVGTAVALVVTDPAAKEQMLVEELKDEPVGQPLSGRDNVP